MMIALLILLLALLIAVSALFSSSETALFSLSAPKIKTLHRSTRPGAKEVAQLLSRPGDLMVTLMMLNITVNILVQNVASNLFGAEAGWWLTVGVPLLLILVLGEAIPKSMAMYHNVGISHKVAPFLLRLRALLTPVRVVLVRVTERLSKAIFFFLRKEPDLSLDELRHALRTSHEHGLLTEEELELMRGYLHLEDTVVKEHMQPRAEVSFYDLEDPLSDLEQLIQETGADQILICEKQIDQVVGILPSYQFFLHADSIRVPQDLSRYIERPFFVPETLAAPLLLSQMYDRHQSIAVVVDEYGSVGGVVSLEDLVEAVVGELGEKKEEKLLYTRSGHDVVIASGKAEIADLERILEVTLPSPSNMVTIGGWLTEQLGDIPQSGVQYHSHGLFFHVLASELTYVRRVYIRKLPKTKAGTNRWDRS